MTKFTDQQSKVRETVVDGLGRMIGVIEDPSSSNYQTTYGYDVLDDLVSVTQGTTQPARVFHYDSLKRLSDSYHPEMDPNGVTSKLAASYAYTNDGLVATRTDGNGVVTNYTYDLLNRLKEKTYTGSAVTPTVTYCYDGTQTSGDGQCTTTATIGLAHGHLTDVRSNLNPSTPDQQVISTTTYNGFDELGRITSSQQVTNQSQPYTFTYCYDRADGLTQMKYPSGRWVATAYDYVERPISLTAYSGTPTTACTTAGMSLGVNYVTALPAGEYAPHGALKSLPINNGRWTETWNYNSRLQPTSLTVGQNFSLGFDYTMSGDSTKNNGNLGSETTTRAGYPSWSHAFIYDGVNRLASAKETTGTGSQLATQWNENYNYDQFGNRWVTWLAGPSLDVYTPTQSSNYDSGNHLNIQTMNYDNAGNLVQRGGYAFVYDAEGRIESSAINAGKTTFVYDAESRRVMRRGSASTTYVYDARGELAAEYSTATSTALCQTCYLSEDHLGSTRLVLDGGTGNPVGCHDFKPFGEEISAGVGGRTATDTCWDASDTTMKFTGKERDAETGLDYFGARYFSSAQGRFTSPDPLMASAKIINPQSWNRYAFVFNNPLRFTDPTGMYTCEGTQDQCKQFEKSRAAILKSKDSDATRAANAYGKAGVDNGVVVRFADKLDDRGGTVQRTDTGLRIDPNNPNKFQATLAVTIQSDNISNQETIAHEGSHVADYQAFVNSIDLSGNMDQSLNITHMATELRAYELSVRYALSGNSSLNFGPCGGVGQECKFSPGMMPASRDQKIMDLLTDPRNHYTGLDRAIYPELLKPQQK